MNRGFTIIEMLVAMAIFTFVAGAASGLFVSSLRAQRVSLARQQLLDQTSYALEYMSRSLRMAKKELFDHPFACLSQRGYNYTNPRGDDSVRFIKYDYEAGQNVCHEFFLDDGQLKEYKMILDGPAGGTESVQPLTSDDLLINSLKFTLTGQSQDDVLQPKVTILLDISGKDQSQIRIQTAISQRDLDIRK